MPIGPALLALVAVAAILAVWLRGKPVADPGLDAAERSPRTSPRETAAERQVATGEVTQPPRTDAATRVAMAAEAGDHVAGAAPAAEPAPNPSLPIDGPHWAETELMTGMGAETHFADTLPAGMGFADTLPAEMNFADTLPAGMNFADTQVTDLALDEPPRLAPAGRRQPA